MASNPALDVRPASAPTPVEHLAALLAEDLAAVDAIIHQRMMSAVGLIPNLAGHLIDAGGKRVRPMITLAAARALGQGIDNARKLAAAVEFIHTATLLHDDVVDASALRRGRPSANILFGNSASVLVGDFLFARAFNLMVETGRVDVLGILANASSVIAEGEVMQLASANDLGVTIDRYLQIIDAKTAALFAAAGEAGALCADGAAEMVEAFAAYGRNIGIAFQLVDDALDYGGQTPKLGKSVGDDFREGKLTLPVLFALVEAQDEDERAFWKRTMGERAQNEGDFELALFYLRRSHALQSTIDQARAFAEAAKAQLSLTPVGPYRDALSALCDFVVERAH